MDRSDETLYAVPVYKITPEAESGEPEIASEDDDTFVRVRHVERQYGDPEVNVTYSKPNETERFRFRITDTERQWCSYRDDPTTLPVEVQHAVHAFGYGIRELESLQNRLFEWMEIHSIFNALDDLKSDYQEWEMFQGPFEDAISSVYDLTVVLLARHSLAEETYWEAWNEYLDTDDFVGMSRTNWIREPLWDASMETLAADRLGRKDGSELNMIASCSERETTAERYLRVDLLTAFGVQPFQFQTTGADTCVFQKPSELRVPPIVIRALQAEGYTVTNSASVVGADSNLEVCERGALFCQAMRDRNLVNEDWEDEEPTDVVNRAFQNVSLIAAVLKLIEIDEETVRKIHDRVLEKRRAEGEFVKDDNDQVSYLFMVLLKALPEWLGDEISEYLQSHPAQEPIQDND